VAGVERVQFAVREELVEILGVRPGHKLVVVTGDDLRRSLDRRQDRPNDPTSYYAMCVRP
jgi:ATP:corrinoid adenosyltransferase